MEFTEELGKRLCQAAPKRFDEGLFGFNFHPWEDESFRSYLIGDEPECLLYASMWSLHQIKERENVLNHHAIAETDEEEWRFLYTFLLKNLRDVSPVIILEKFCEWKELCLENSEISLD